MLTTATDVLSRLPRGRISPLLVSNVIVAAVTMRFTRSACGEFIRAVSSLMSVLTFRLRFSPSMYLYRSTLLHRRSISDALILPFFTAASTAFMSDTVCMPESRRSAPACNASTQLFFPSTFAPFISRASVYTRPSKPSSSRNTPVVILCDIEA